MVSYHRVSFTSQYEQLFASVQNCTTSFWMQGVYIVYWVTSLLMYCNASAWDCKRCWKMTTRTANNRRDHERTTTITRIFCEPMETRLWSAAEEREKADVDEEIRNDWMLAAAFVDRILFITFSFLFVGSASLFFTVFLLGKFPAVSLTLTNDCVISAAWRSSVCLCRPVCRLIRSTPNTNVAIHCYVTLLKVEGLEKRVGLNLARSRSRLVAKIRRLGLILVSQNCRKVLVSVSFRTKNRISRSHLGLVS